jgi:hypothetical protein
VDISYFIAQSHKLAVTFENIAENMISTKGIYCIEGLWNHQDIKDKSSILPILNLLNNRKICDYIYHDCATKSELEFLISKWVTKSVNTKYPILYFAFHGDVGCISLTHKENYSLDELAELLLGKCTGKIIYFGSCLTLNTHKTMIKNFLEKTNALAIIGYKTEIDWIQSTACDLFTFEALQSDKFDTKGIKNIHTQITSNYGNLHKILELNVVINEKHFARKRI